MGMLLTYRKGYWPEGDAPKPKRKRAPRRRKAEVPAETPAADESGTYADLSDEQVAEAYAVTIPDGEATERAAQVIELRAVAAFAHTFGDTPEQ